MNADSLVEQLAKVLPNPDVLMAMGVDQSFINERVQARVCHRRSQPLRQFEGDDPLMQLLGGWSVEALEIGQVRLSGILQPKVPGYLMVGEVEADPLVLDTATGEIVVHELGASGHLLWRVARDGGRLLDALLIAATFLTSRLNQEVAYDDFRAARRAALECSVAAGGEPYHNFYRMLLGSEP